MKQTEVTWKEIEEVLKRDYSVSNVEYETWIKPLKLVKIDDNTIGLVVSDDMHRQYLQERLKDKFQKAINEITKKEYKIKYLSWNDIVINYLKVQD